MKRNRPHILTAVLAVAAAVLAPSAAHAVTTGTAASYVTVQLATQPYLNGSPSGAPTPLNPTSTGADGVQIMFFKLDQGSGAYGDYKPTGAWTPVSGNTWMSPALDAGTYRVMFLPVSTSMPLGYLGVGGTGGLVPFFFTDWTNPTEKTTDVVVQTTDTSANPQPLGAVTLQQDRSFYTDRLAGSDRFATAVSISQALFPGASGPMSSPATAPDVIYLVNGLNYPDALAAGPAAIAHGGGLLLAAPTTLPATTAAELKRLHPSRLVIAGGPSAVSDSVMNAAGAAAGVSPQRIGGTDRYDTAALIARDAFITHPGGAVPGVDPNAIVLIATGANYPDALSAGPAAGAQGAPLVLVNGSANTVPEATLQLLTDLHVKHVGIVGSQAVVSAGIQQQLNALYPGVARYAGATRYETARIIGDAFFFGSETVALASGMNFPDALAGGPFAALALAGPVYLTPPSCLGGGAIDGMYDQHANEAVLLGGPGAITTDVENLALCDGVVLPAPHNTVFPSSASVSAAASRGGGADVAARSVQGDRRVDTSSER